MGIIQSPLHICTKQWYDERDSCTPPKKETASTTDTYCGWVSCDKRPNLEWEAPKGKLSLCKWYEGRYMRGFSLPTRHPVLYQRKAIIELNTCRWRRGYASSHEQ